MIKKINIPITTTKYIVEWYRDGVFREKVVGSKSVASRVVNNLKRNKRGLIQTYPISV